MSKLREATGKLKTEWEKLSEEEKKKKPFSVFVRAKQLKSRRKKLEESLDY